MNRIDLCVEGAVAIVTIRRPEKRNALDQDMIDELRSLVQTIDRSQDVAVVILTGVDRAFCAGGDISAWSEEAPEDFGEHWVRDGHAVFDALARLRQPVIAALNGHVLGGGLELACCADYRIAERSIRIGQPETGLGIIPGWSGTQRAVRRFGAQLVRRMALFGEVFIAEQGLALGLVDQVVDDGESLNAARVLADRLLQRGPLATRVTKMLINAAEGEERERVVEALAGIAAAQSSELQAGLRAFRERRTADFRNEGD